MSDLTYIIGYMLLFLLNAQMLSSWLVNPIAHREEAFFGLRVKPEVLSGPGQRVLHQYRVWLVTTFIAFETINLCLPIYLHKLSYLLYLRSASNVLWPVCAIILFGVFQERVKVFGVVEQKEKVVGVALSLKTRRLRDYTNITFEVINASIFLAALLISIYGYAALPERLPTHASWRGVIDGWAPKNFHTMFGGLIWLVYIQIGLVLLKSALVHSPKALPLQQTEERLQYSEKFLRLATNWLDWARGVWLFSMLGGIYGVLIWLHDGPKLMANVVHVSTLGIVINIASQVIFWSLVTLPTLHFIYRQYQLDREMKPVEWSRLPRPIDEEHFSLGGLIYFNPDNPALLVKGPRVHTINLANQWVYLCVAYFIGVALLIAWAPELV